MAFSELEGRPRRQEIVRMFKRSNHSHTDKEGGLTDSGRRLAPTERSTMSLQDTPAVLSTPLLDKPLVVSANELVVAPANEECILDRALEHGGRILQRVTGGKFELFLTILGVVTRLAVVNTEAEAHDIYVRATTILKPAVHNPYAPPSQPMTGGLAAPPPTTVEVPVDSSSILAMHMPRATHLEPPATSITGATGATSSDQPSSGSTLDASGETTTNVNAANDDPLQYARKLALKSLAAPPEEPNSKRRKLSSQKSLRAAATSATGGSGSGRGRGGGLKGLKLDGKRHDENLFKLDVFTTDDPATAVALAAAAAEAEATSSMTLPTPAGSSSSSPPLPVPSSQDLGPMLPREQRVCGLCGGSDEDAAALTVHAWDSKTALEDTCRDFDGQVRVWG